MHKQLLNKTFKVQGEANYGKTFFNFYDDDNFNMFDTLHLVSGVGSTYASDNDARLRAEGEANAEAIRKSREAAATIVGLAGIISGVKNGTSGNTGNTNTSNTNNRTTQTARANLPKTPFVYDPLSNFRVSSETVQVCIWDYACEDGDRVTVRASGNRSITLFNNRKLTNAKQCRTVNLNQLVLGGVSNGSRVTLHLKADNGTGNEGQCSYEDVNTGKMSVSGGGGQDTWSLRGGTGSNGSITYKP